MDNGEEIPGLDEQWTLAGGRITDWTSGLMMCLVASEIFGLKKGSDAPVLIFVLIGTVLGLVALRRKFPDEERGIANWFFTSLGMRPPLIPPPAALQPIWSGSPVRELGNNKEFVQLGLGDALKEPGSGNEGETDPSIERREG